MRSPDNEPSRMFADASQLLRFPASLEAPYHTVDALHDALRATVARSDSLTLEWLLERAPARARLGPTPTTSTWQHAGSTRPPMRHSTS